MAEKPMIHSRARQLASGSWYRSLVVHGSKFLFWFCAQSLSCGIVAGMNLCFILLVCCQTRPRLVLHGPHASSTGWTGSAALLPVQLVAMQMVLYSQVLLLQDCNMYRLGFCVYGPNCRYRHDPLPGPPPPPDTVEAARPRPRYGQDFNSFGRGRGRYVQGNIFLELLPKEHANRVPKYRRV